MTPRSSAGRTWKVRVRNERGVRRCVTGVIRRCHGFRSVSGQSSKPSRARVHRRHLRPVSEEGDRRDQRARPRDRPGGRPRPCGGAGLRRPARGDLPAQEPAPDGGGARGGGVLRPRWAGPPQVDQTPASGPGGRLRDERRQVRGPRGRGCAALARARAPRRAAEDRRRHGARCPDVPERRRLPTFGRGRGPAGRDPEVHADDRRPARPGHRRVPRRAGSEAGLLGGLQSSRPLVGRAPAILAVLTGIALYYGFSGDLRNLSTWGDVAFLAVVLIPGAFLLIWLALPLYREAGARTLAGAALGFGGLAVLLELLGLDVAANFAKFAAVTAAGWWFLTFFEAVSWVLLVALLIVPIDTYSVFQGPTKVIVEEQPQVFDALSIAFPLPGEHNSAQLGLPDVLFFALFLAATVRFHLRPALTWLAMALSFGATLAIAVGAEVAGLPALPLLSAAFVLVNADLIWRSLRPGQPDEGKSDDDRGSPSPSA